MNSIQEEIRKIIDIAAKKLDKGWEGATHIEYPSEASHGEYSSNVALQMAKSLQMSPREVAEKLKENIELPSSIKSVKIAGPGFLNFYIAPEFFSEMCVQIILEKESFGNSEYGKGKTMATDISHPNVAKPMGVHHLLSTIIGDSINRMIAATGYTLIRDNYLGDWGTQFGKLIYAYRKWGDENQVKKDPIPELLKLYVKFHDEAEKDDTLEDLGRAEFKKLEDGDKENRKLWQWVVDLSLSEFHKIWDRLDVKFDYIHGESFYEDKMQEIIEMGIKKGVFTDGERGALIAAFPHEKYPPAIIRKSDGATTYCTRDLARTKYWEDNWHPDYMVNVVDVAQQVHFQQVFETSELLGLTDGENIHVWFGRMSFPEKRMSTRKGDMILLEELLDEAVANAYKIVSEKNPHLSEEKRHDVSREVGIGAVKYAVLSQNRTTNITFTWDKMLSLDGNSAPYVQYVHARACSILRKGEWKDEDASTSNKYTYSQPEELKLARLLPRLPEVVIHSVREFKPNLLANYIYEVASAFNTFYGSVSVLDSSDNEKAARLKLTRAVTVVIERGLFLLGISSPEEM